ncbi:hypothetical protein F5148DRAFT_977417, partial [Russula earlei]
PTTVEDPARRALLFYHLVPPPMPLSDTCLVFAMSLLSDPPPSSASSTVHRWLPAETPGDDRDAGLNDFAISEGLTEGVDDIQAAGALQLGNSWMHIHDERNIPPLNCIGDPDDILASVRVEDGKASLTYPMSLVLTIDKHSQILPETYQAMPSYRLCTVHGVTQLTEELASKLQGL